MNTQELLYLSQIKGEIRNEYKKMTKGNIQELNGNTLQKLVPSQLVKFLPINRIVSIK